MHHYLKIFYVIVCSINLISCATYQSSKESHIEYLRNQPLPQISAEQIKEDLTRSCMLESITVRMYPLTGALEYAKEYEKRDNSKKTTHLSLPVFLTATNISPEEINPQNWSFNLLNNGKEYPLKLADSKITSREISYSIPIHNPGYYNPVTKVYMPGPPSYSYVKKQLETGLGLLVLENIDKHKIDISQGFKVMVSKRKSSQNCKLTWTVSSKKDNVTAK
jgi:hypothetical protein